MVEVKLETTGFDKFAQDHYISVRVGEAQKLARLCGSRNFKFPASAIGGRKYGKVEIFRRVGAGAVCIDPVMASGVNEVEVVFGGTNLRFTAEVSAIEPEEKAQKHVEGKQAEKKSAAHQKAMDYLEEHHLEVRLADAMQAVLRERPADPAAFIAEKLVGNAALVAKLPAKQKAAAAAPVAPKAPKLGADAFGTYYQAYFTTAAGTPGLYAKFPARAMAAPAAKKAPPAAPAALGPRPRQFLPSMGRLTTLLQ